MNPADWPDVGPIIARRLDGVQVTDLRGRVSPTLHYGPSFEASVVVRRKDVKIALKASSLEAACDEVDEAFPLPTWWRQLAPKDAPA